MTLMREQLNTTGGFPKQISAMVNGSTRNKVIVLTASVILPVKFLRKPFKALNANCGPLIWPVGNWLDLGHGKAGVGHAAFKR